MNFLKTYKSQIALTLTILFLALIFIDPYKYQLNPDGISYVSIAKYYLNGNFDIAINGYWSPLYSFLLVPLLLLKIPELLATKILGVILAWLVVMGIRKLLLVLNVNKNVNFVVCLATIPLILFYGFYLIVPDLLVVLILILYLKSLLEFFASPTVKLAKWIGIWGGLGYLAKSYFLPFFLLNLVIISIFFYIKFRKEFKIKQMLLFLFSILLPVILICVPWIILISIKYQTFTISTSGAYNWALIGPETRGVHYLQSTNLVVPQDSRFPNAWVDPSYFKLPQWSAFQNSETITYYIGKIFTNIKLLFKYLRDFSMFFPFLGLLIFMFWDKSNKKKLKKKIINDSNSISSISTTVILITAIVFPSGYFLVLIEERYVWFLLILLLIGFVLLFDKYLKSIPKGDSKVWIYVLLIIVMGYFAYSGFTQLNGHTKNDDIINFAQVIKKEIDLKDKNIANQVNDLNWYMHLSYFLDAKYLGQYNTDNVSPEAFYKNLEEKNINYYFVQGGTEINMDKYPIVFSSEEKHIKLYEIKK